MRITQWFGFNPPFLTESEVLSPQTDLRLIKNDILQLLLTGLKERVMRPNFGTPIRTTPFEQNDSFTAGNLKNAIFQAIKNVESRVGVRDIVIGSDPDSGIMSVTVLAYLKNDPNRTIFPVEAEFVSPKGNFGSAPIRLITGDNNG